MAPTARLGKKIFLWGPGAGPKVGFKRRRLGPVRWPEFPTIVEPRTFEPENSLTNSGIYAKNSFGIDSAPGKSGREMQELDGTSRCFEIM